MRRPSHFPTFTVALGIPTYAVVCTHTMRHSPAQARRLDKSLRHQKGKSKSFKGKKGRPDSDALDRELETYWMKKGEKNIVTNHLDNDMDEYWKNAGKQAASVNANESTISMNSKISVTGSPPIKNPGLKISAF